MRRPSKTARQRQYAREQRATRALVKAAARYTIALECDDLILAGYRETELHAAALKLGNTVAHRDLRRLSK